MHGQLVAASVPLKLSQQHKTNGFPQWPKVLCSPFLLPSRITTGIDFTEEDPVGPCFASVILGNGFRS